MMFRGFWGRFEFLRMRNFFTTPIPVVSLLSVGAFLVTLEDCVHPISESIQCEDWLKWGIFVPTHLAPTTINVQGKVPLA